MSQLTALFAVKDYTVEVERPLRSELTGALAALRPAASAGGELRASGLGWCRGGR